MNTSTFHIKSMCCEQCIVEGNRIFENAGLTSLRWKVEKAKELLILNQIDISEMAWLLGCSTSQNLSTQFKRETEKTPGKYRGYPDPQRIQLPKFIKQNLNKNAE